MKLAVAGINHRTAPVELREKIAFRTEEIPAALLELQANGAKEAVILSTCNRVEVTAAVDGDVDACSLLERLVVGRDGLTPGVLRPHVYVFEDRSAIQH